MIAAIEPTAFVAAAVFALTILAVAYGLKTRKGSGIDEHPGPDSGNPPSDSGVEGSEQDLPDEADRPESTLLDQHGKK